MADLDPWDAAERRMQQRNLQSPQTAVIDEDLLPLADLRLWETSLATPKAFLMAGFVPAREPTLFTGKGGANKSTTALQLCMCCAAGVAMLGVDVQQCGSLYITAEDDEDRLHWSVQHMASALGIRLGDLLGKLHVSSLRGRLGNELATIGDDGRLRPTETFESLKSTIRSTRAKLVVLDNVAHLYCGNENDRMQVTAFVNLLCSLCRDFDCTVVLIAHTNKAGDSFSGSTAWLNAVRSQIVIERPEDSLDPDERVLTVGKANYARQGEELRFRWHDFALVRDEDLPADTRAEIAQVVATNAENDAFLRCLRVRTEQGEGRLVGPSPGPNYAPSQFEGMAEARGLSKGHLKRAMDRLFTIGAIESYTYHNSSKGRNVTVIREVENAPRTLPRTLPEHFPQSAPNTHPNAPAHTLPPKGGNGAAPQAAAPSLDKPAEPDLSRPVFPAADDDSDLDAAPYRSGGWG